MADTSSMQDPFPVRTRGPVDIVVHPPGSKSQTNRALVCAALATGESTLARPLRSDDSDAMVRCLQSLGIQVDKAPDAWHVHGTAGVLEEGPEAHLDVGASGTTARFVTALAALAPRRSIIDGTPRMRERPMRPLVDTLRQLGVDIDDTDGFQPVSVQGGSLAGGMATIDASASSQFLSALLMVAPYTQGELEIRVEGLTSAGYIRTTLEVMKRFGVDVETLDVGYRVVPAPYHATTLGIESDASAAVYPWAAAAMTAGRATVTGIDSGSSQPDLGILPVLKEMGCVVEGFTVQGPDRLNAVETNLQHMPDGAMTVAVLCAAASGTSRLSGLHTLRMKETDRMAALVNELGRLGVVATADEDSLTIEGTESRTPGTVETYQDHRMAMAFSLLGLVTEGIQIADPECVTKTWPTYFQELATW